MGMPSLTWCEGAAWARRGGNRPCSLRTRAMGAAGAAPTAPACRMEAGEALGAGAARPATVAGGGGGRRHDARHSSPSSHCAWPTLIARLRQTHSLAASAPLQGEAYLAQLDPLLQRLNEGGPGVKFDRKGLAALFSGLQQFMEDALGINVRPCAVLAVLGPEQGSRCRRAAAAAAASRRLPRALVPPCPAPLRRRCTSRLCGCRPTCWPTCRPTGRCTPLLRRAGR